MASPTPTTPAECPQTDLLRALQALHAGSKYADLRIVCGFREWLVHRAIICSRSAFFDGACGSAFSEAANGVIDLSEDDEEAVDQMIHFFYHLDYLSEPLQPPAIVFRHRALSNERRKLPKKLDLSMCDPLLAAAGCYTPESPTSPPKSAVESRETLDPPAGKTPRSPTRMRAGTPPLVSDDGSDYESDGNNDDDPEDESRLLLHTRVYALAEKYDIPALKNLALRKFEMAMACYYDSPDLPAAIADIYCSTIDTDRGLRDIVCEAFVAHPQLASTPDVLAVLHELPSLALDLFKLERGIPVSLLGG